MYNHNSNRLALPGMDKRVLVVDVDTGNQVLETYMFWAYGGLCYGQAGRIHGRYNSIVVVVITSMLVR
jgi:hypothetical protein